MLALSVAMLAFKSSIKDELVSLEVSIRNHLPLEIEVNANSARPRSGRWFWKLVRLPKHQEYSTIRWPIVEEKSQGKSVTCL